MIPRRRPQGVVGWNGAIARIVREQPPVRFRPQTAARQSRASPPNPPLRTAGQPKAEREVARSAGGVSAYESKNE